MKLKGEFNYTFNLYSEKTEHFAYPVIVNVFLLMCGVF